MNGKKIVSIGGLEFSGDCCHTSCEQTGYTEPRLDLNCGDITEIRNLVHCAPEDPLQPYQHDLNGNDVVGVKDYIGSGDLTVGGQVSAVDVAASGVISGSAGQVTTTPGTSGTDIVNVDYLNSKLPVYVENVVTYGDGIDTTAATYPGQKVTVDLRRQGDASGSVASSVQVYQLILDANSSETASVNVTASDSTGLSADKYGYDLPAGLYTFYVQLSGIETGLIGDSRVLSIGTISKAGTDAKLAAGDVVTREVRFVSASEKQGLRASLTGQIRVDTDDKVVFFVNTPSDMQTDTKPFRVSYIRHALF